jgi:surface antigen
LLRDTQAFGAAAPSERAAGAAKLLALLLCMLPLAACASGGIDMSKLDVDHTLQTSTTGASAVPDQTRVSDSMIIRNAVSAADIEALRQGAPLAWANTDTGSRGTISGVSETKAAGVLCRTFTASRESYDGVGLYKGEACRGDQGSWHIQTFEPM